MRITAILLYKIVCGKLYTFEYNIWTAPTVSSSHLPMKTTTLFLVGVKLVICVFYFTDCTEKDTSEEEEQKPLNILVPGTAHAKSEPRRQYLNSEL